MTVKSKLTIGEVAGNSNPTNVNRSQCLENN